MSGSSAQFRGRKNHRVSQILPPVGNGQSQRYEVAPDQPIVSAQLSHEDLTFLPSGRSSTDASLQLYSVPSSIAPPSFSSTSSAKPFPVPNIAIPINFDVPEYGSLLYPNHPSFATKEFAPRHDLFVPAHSPALSASDGGTHVSSQLSPALSSASFSITDENHGFVNDAAQSSFGVLNNAPLADASPFWGPSIENNSQQMLFEDGLTALRLAESSATEGEISIKVENVDQMPQPLESDTPDSSRESSESGPVSKKRKRAKKAEKKSRKFIQEGFEKLGTALKAVSDPSGQTQGEVSRRKMLDMAATLIQELKVCRSRLCEFEGREERIRGILNEDSSSQI